jgi:hypothetical protein
MPLTGITAFLVSMESIIPQSSDRTKKEEESIKK